MQTELSLPPKAEHLRLLFGSNDANFRCGLTHATEILADVPGVVVVRMDGRNIVRHRLV